VKLLFDLRILAFETEAESSLLVLAV